MHFECECSTFCKANKRDLTAWQNRHKKRKDNPRREPEPNWGPATMQANQRYRPFVTWSRYA